MKKKFLGTFALLASSFVAQQATANTVPSFEPTSMQTQSTTESLATDLINTRNEAGELSNFVLKRSAETGQLMASHESHRSHASHRSHYSSR